MKNLYMPEVASIIEVYDENEMVLTLTMSLDSRRQLESIPGQFIELTIFGHGEFPVSISGIPKGEKQHFQATIQKIGKVTNEIVQLSPGDKVGIRGPFGNGFPLEELQGKDVCLVTGGVGLAAVKHLLDYLNENRNRYGKITLLHGAKTPDALIYKHRFFSENGGIRLYQMDVDVTVDEAGNGWQGNVGVVTRLLNDVVLDVPNTVAVVCGPSVMMKFACIGLQNLGLRAEQIILSMERKMQCGMGVCGHCMIGRKRVCVDGPVFYFNQIGDVLERIF